MDLVISALGVFVPILTGLVGVIYVTINKRIDKLEENSRRDDEKLEEEHKELRVDVKEVDAKYRDNDRDLYVLVNNLAIAVARFEEKLKCMKEKT